MPYSKLQIKKNVDDSLKSSIYLINRRCSSDHILISVVDSSRVTIHFVSKYIISLYYQYYIVIHMKRLYTSLNERMLWAAKLRR